MQRRKIQYKCAQHLYTAAVIWPLNIMTNHSTNFMNKTSTFPGVLFTAMQLTQVQVCSSKNWLLYHWYSMCYTVRQKQGSWPKGLINALCNPAIQWNLKQQAWVWFQVEAVLLLGSFPPPPPQVKTGADFHCPFHLHMHSMMQDLHKKKKRSQVHLLIRDDQMPVIMEIIPRNGIESSMIINVMIANYSCS